MPLPRVAVRPITFATSVLNVRYSLSATPRNIVFISGMPEPMGCDWWWWRQREVIEVTAPGTATGSPVSLLLRKSSFQIPILWGAIKWTNPAENNIKHTGSDTHAMYCTTGCDVRSLYNQTLANGWVVGGWSHLDSNRATSKRKWRATHHSCTSQCPCPWQTTGWPWSGRAAPGTPNPRPCARTFSATPMRWLSPCGWRGGRTIPGGWEYIWVCVESVIVRRERQRTRAAELNVSLITSKNRYLWLVSATYDAARGIG